MAGICGIISLRGKASDLKIPFHNMVKALCCLRSQQVHTEPLDQIGYLGAVTIASDRPHQKRFADDKEEIVCVIDGNIFLDTELKRTIRATYVLKEPEFEEELVPYLYRTFGIDFVLKVTGWFNIAFFDRKKQEVMVFNSRFGMLPLYYARVNDLVIFASRLEPIMATGLVSLQIDRACIVEQAVFNYPISDRTFIKPVRTLPAGSRLRIYDGDVRLKRYWDVRRLFTPPEYRKKDGVEAIHNVFSKVIQKLTSRFPRFGVSLTGGWDGRLVLSYLGNCAKDRLFLYSFGAKHSPDVTIPDEIGRKMGYQYRPFILDKSYLTNDFLTCADETIRSSGGIRNYLRTHYLYAMKAVSQDTDLILTGNCGSNLLKVTNDTGPVMNENIIKIFSVTNLDNDLLRVIYTDFDHTGFMAPVPHGEEEFIEGVRSADIHGSDGLSLNQRLYTFLLTLVERKYFGLEMCTYAPYLYNFSPFIDYEFIETLMKTPFYGGHFPFFSRALRHRAMATGLYAELVSSNSPALAAFVTDRGFSLADAMTVQGKAKAYYHKCLKKMIKKVTVTDYFFTHGTHDAFFHGYRNLLAHDDLFNLETFEEAILNRSYVQQKSLFANCLSSFYWKRHNELSL